MTAEAFSRVVDDIMHDHPSMPWPRAIEEAVKIIDGALDSLPRSGKL